MELRGAELMRSQFSWPRVRFATIVATAQYYNKGLSGKARELEDQAIVVTIMVSILLKY